MRSRIGFRWRKNPVQNNAVMLSRGTFGQRVAAFAVNSPAMATIFVFIILVLISASLLMLPISSSGGTATPMVDAVFIAVSAICVAGLSTLDMAHHWSGFGNAVVLLSLQIGGIGVMTLATLLALLASKRLGMSARRILASDVDASRLHEKKALGSHGVELGDIRGILGTVVVSTFVIEMVLAAIFAPRLWLSGTDLPAAIWQGIFLSVSVFTNTGFWAIETSLQTFQADPVMMGTITVGGFLGSLGFPVILALWRAVLVMRARRKRKTLKRPYLGLHAKLTLSTSLVLLFIGALLLGAFEWNNPSTFGNQSTWVKVMNAIFASAMARSAGFNAVPIDQMDTPSILVLDMLMFVGGGSASTAGGIKVTTLAVLFLAAVAESRGNQDLVAYERRIPSDVVRLAVTVSLWGASIVAVSTILILIVTEAPLDKVLFDVISAFATCGLSSGLTSPDLDPEAKYILAVTMLLGRVGTVTLATAISGTHRQTVYRRAAERPIVG